MSTRTTTPELEPAHGFRAAEELLHDLMQHEELAPYVMPEIWRKRDQHTTIANLSKKSDVTVAVGLAETSLPAAGQQKQGGMVRVGLAIYVFQRAEGSSQKPDAELRHRVWLTAIKYASAWSYTLVPGKTIKGYLTSVAEVDLASINDKFAKEVNADALIIEIPLMLTAKKP